MTLICPVSTATTSRTGKGGLDGVMGKRMSDGEERMSAEDAAAIDQQVCPSQRATLPRPSPLSLCSAPERWWVARNPRVSRTNRNPRLYTGAAGAFPAWHGRLALRARCLRHMSLPLAIKGPS